MVACPFRLLVVLYRMLAIFIMCEMIDVWDTISSLIHPLGCFCPRTIFAKKRIGQVTTDLLFIRFTYYNKDNQQECSLLSNWFPLWCLGPWMNHLPPVWWSTFRFGFFNVSWCVSLVWRRGVLATDLLPLFMFYTLPSFAYHFPLKCFDSQIHTIYTRIFILLVFCNAIFHRLFLMKWVFCVWIFEIFLQHF